MLTRMSNDDDNNDEDDNDYNNDNNNNSLLRLLCVLLIVVCFHFPSCCYGSCILSLFPYIGAFRYIGLSDSRVNIVSTTLWLSSASSLVSFTFITVVSALQSRATVALRIYYYFCFYYCLYYCYWICYGCGCGYCCCQLSLTTYDQLMMSSIQTSAHSCSSSPSAL